MVTAKVNQGTPGCLRPVLFLSFLAWALGSNWVKIYLYMISAFFEHRYHSTCLRGGFINSWGIFLYSMLAMFSKGAICAAHPLWGRSQKQIPLQLSLLCIWSRRSCEDTSLMVGSVARSKSCFLPRFSFPFLGIYPSPKRKGDELICPWRSLNYFWDQDFFWFHQAPFLLIL